MRTRHPLSLVFALVISTAGALHAAADEEHPATLEAAMGLALFERQWVPAPSSTTAADGLGPFFNARSCNSCHAGAGPARFTYRDGNWKARGLLVRTATQEGLPHPQLGLQIQDCAEPSLMPEGRVVLEGNPSRLTVSVHLLRPGNIPVRYEARIAPSLQSAALFEQVDEKAILALSDLADRDGDGISGRPNFVTDASGQIKLGLYGAKASVSDLEQQISNAAALDLGLSSPLMPQPAGDCTKTQTDCIIRTAATTDREHEISSDSIRLIAAYLESLPPPETDEGLEGQNLFSQFGCAACHVPSLPSKQGKSLALFSDFLLHDLGHANASILREGSAAPGEWRTSPLRSLASPEGTRRYMHDGRAATLTEAIGWHGGEASRAREAFLQSDGRERHMLLDFLSKL